MSMKINKRFADRTFENYKCETKQQKDLVEYLKKCCEDKKFPENVVIMGNVGMGKTHLIYSIFNKCCTRKKTQNTSSFYKTDYEYYSQYDDDYKKICPDFHYTTIKDIIDSIKTSWSEKEVANLEKEKTCDVLIVDEVGVQYGTDMERTELFEIFNYRYNEMLPTIIVSNNSKEQIFDILGKRIADRLFGDAKVFILQGRSKRGEV